jgi:hypothetical protein
VWLVHELVRLVARVAIGFVIALVLAAIWALVSDHSFTHDLRITTLTIGLLLMLMAAIGRGSNFERAMDFGVTQELGRVPGMSSIHRTGEDRTLTPGAVFFFSGAALLALGLFVL